MKNNSARRGQAMLIATLSLGGAILSATSIAGLLLMYQIRSTTDSANSAKAIFAADAGVEWSLYSYFNPPEGPLPTFGNGAVASTTCYDGNNTLLSYCDDLENAPATTSYAISEGLAGGTRRAFLLDLSTATGTLP
jgi:hypothetical protein